MKKFFVVLILVVLIATFVGCCKEANTESATITAEETTIYMAKEKDVDTLVSIWLENEVIEYCDWDIYPGIDRVYPGKTLKKILEIGSYTWYINSNIPSKEVYLIQESGGLCRKYIIKADANIISFFGRDEQNLPVFMGENGETFVVSTSKGFVSQESLSDN